MKWDKPLRTCSLTEELMARRSFYLHGSPFPRRREWTFYTPLTDHAVSVK